MRISPSPVEIRNKFISKPYQGPILTQNNRSSSLSNSALHSSKLLSRVETPYISPYYNQNSGIFIASQQEIGYEPKMSGKTIGNSQNVHVLQNTVKHLSERVQIIQKQLKSQESHFKLNSKLSNQNQIKDFIQDRIVHQLQKKAHSQYELLFHQIRRLEQQILQKTENHATNEYGLLGTSSILELGRQKINEQEITNIQKKSLVNMVEEKVREEIFRLQIHLENQMNKALKTLKNSSQHSNQPSSPYSNASKSTLKYKYRPVHITVKNQVRTHLQDPSIKRKKETLSTSYSTGSSDDNQQKHQTVLDFLQFTYFIDREGYLLDEEGYYLLDEKDKMIKVDKRLLKKLRDFNMVQ